MTDIAANLKDRFSTHEHQLLEWWDILGFPTEDDSDDRWTRAEDRALEILKTCRLSVDAVPSEQMAATKVLFERNPIAFEEAATSLTQAIGVTFFPENAATFCEVLSDGLK